MCEPRAHQTTFTATGSLAPCVSPTHPEIVGADFTSSGHGVASCTTADFEDTATYRWNTGQSSKVEGRVTINLKPNGQTVLVRIGEVTGGLFKGATVTQTKVLPALTCWTAPPMTAWNTSAGPSTSPSSCRRGSRARRRRPRTAR